ncbi:protocadherin Fat 2 isoform X1 [Gouania willdenowi]|uniref:protocadherin Fat 2 isoform X1 n=1 Tax=Gouania willdenowi TaxID=441366 RepID=UPI0010549A4B|nr:protocadherin Fat 2 isoform X1 [Gouania willdenowi]
MELKMRSKGLLLLLGFFLVSLSQSIIENLKDSAPLRFTQPLYNATINENSAPRTYVSSSVWMGVELIDILWEVTYEILLGDVDEFFQADALRVGDFCFLRIKTRSGNSALLNREVRDSYMLTVKAEETHSHLQAKTNVYIQVMDTNDLKPLFFPASYGQSVREDLPLRSSVLKVTATDADIGSNADFYYSFTSRAHPFVVDPFTGMISLAKTLNHSRAHTYELTVLAEDRAKKISGVQKFGNLAKVRVNVQKMSTKFPVIAPSPKVMVSYDGKVTIDVHVVAGLKPVQSLRVVGGDSHNSFEVVPSVKLGTNFQVISTKRINWSQCPSGLNLSLQASDSSSPSLLSPVTLIHIPASHFSPLAFTEDTYTVNLSEFSPVHTYVLKVSLTSALQNISFSIRNYRHRSGFKINPRTGIIVTTRKFDYEAKQRRFEFDVVANHEEAETHVVVHIQDENDNSPRFSQPSYDASVDENVPVGSSVLKVTASDRDSAENGFLTYAIANSGAVPFIIDAFTGVISTSQHLDYELMNRWYHLRVWASDSGRPFSRASECAVTITMNNVNDNVPLFEYVDCNLTVQPDLPKGHAILNLSAIDRDELQQLRYKIEAGNELQVFRMNPVSGALVLHEAIPVSVGSFTLEVTASDGEHRSEVLVVRVTVTNTGDESVVQCKETGIIKELNDKLINSIRPVLTNQEEETFSDIHITNRHVPAFDRNIVSSINLSEDHQLNSLILQVKASDGDSGFNGKLVYSISGGNEDGCFYIDLFSGDLQLVCTLDRESKELYILNITVYDLGVPQTSAWKLITVNILDVNDNRPVFGQPRYVLHIPEDMELDSVVFKAQAVDSDPGSNIQYSLLTSTDMFRLDPDTGNMRLTSRLDRERSHRHDVRIQARDQEAPDQSFSITDLVVVVKDINDNPPKFLPQIYTVKVPEDVPVGTLLVWVETVDMDLGGGGMVSYKLKNTESGTFHLDSSTGALTLEKDLDFEKSSSYNLTVWAVDHGLPRSLSSSCFLQIQVLDVNENLYTPTFSELVYEAAVMENMPAGTSVVTLTASDEDKGRDGDVRYRIHDGSGLGVFAIDEKTGVIRTLETLDRELVPHYWLSVCVSDLGTKPLLSWTHVFLEVLDVNDNVPQFSQPLYFGSVSEEQDSVPSLLQLQASDKDTSSEGRLSFHIHHSHRSQFTVEPKTGVLGTKAALDREDKPEHTLEVVVSDNGSPPLRSTATVIIRVLDINDNKPKFTDKLFHVKLLEQSQHAGPQEVCRMVARDEDDGVNAAVKYKLQDGDGQFEIDALTGVVTSHGEFHAGNYTILTVRATDGGRPSRSSTARLDVQWIDRPLPSPEPITFADPLFTFAVMETEPVTHMVGIISTETHRQRWFHIVDGDADRDFDIGRESGTLSIARRLNATRHNNYTLTVLVSDGYHSATTQAYIRVLDMNEHRPVFLKTLYQVQVPEDAPPWSNILQVSATDADVHSQMLFSIHSSIHPNSSASFQLHPRSGVLVLTQKLDYEEATSHTLIIMVRDQKIPVKRNFAKVEVQVEDCNDHSPAFLSSRYDANVSNLATPGTPVIRVTALDKDQGSNAHIKYTLHSGNIDGVFSIDPELGSIVVAKQLDLQPLDRFHLTVTASDHGFPQLSDICSVHVHVQTSDRTPPAFPSEEYLTEISESSGVGTSVLSVSVSSPAAVHYGIESGDPLGTFYINPYTGLISTLKLLDYEQQKSYKLKVAATSTAGVWSRTLVHIYVKDENDNEPMFHQGAYTGYISEAAPENSMVMWQRNTPLVVQASDADQDSNSVLTYQILEADALKVFKIDSNTGSLSLVSLVDFETKPEYHFTVQVKDSGVPSLYAAEPAKVTVQVLDLNDCPPKFSMPVYEPSVLLPSVQNAEVVRVMAHDADSAISYDIVEGNVHNAFSIHPDSGLITVSNHSEFRSSYKLTVTASDGLYTASATVRVNTSNLTMSDLTFEQEVYSARVPENLQTVQTLAVLKVRGCYLNEPLVYSIINPAGRFSISPTSGVLKSTSLPFDREEQNVHNLVVKVEDMREPSRTATVQVKVFIEDVNDNPPQFVNLPYSVMIAEDSEPGDVLFQVSAEDKDLEENGSIIYSLEEDFHLFRVDPRLGDVSLQKPLDFESLNKYVLTVSATDEGKPKHRIQAQLSLQVRNRTNPIFQTLLYPLKVPENTPPFTTILHVQARNPEGYRLIYSLQEENASKNFQLDFKTGVLSVVEPMDYESQTLHSLTVRATDSVTGVFSEASVEIEVEDVNDNAPVFSQLTYSTNISEGLPVSTSVFQLSASDKDSGRNKDVTFQIVGNNEGYFGIDPLTGILFTQQVLDYESRKDFILKVKAVDNGSVPLSAEALVSVNVTDVNDNPPDFLSPKYEATLDELANCGHIVIKIQASDPDTSDQNDLRYKILSGNEDRYFHINQSSGIISFSNVCRRNLDPHYNLTVAVTDGVFQRTAPVNIDMINSNRHSPHFKQSVYEAELAENAKAGTPVIRVAAIDPDDGLYGNVDYTIINKLAKEKFEIHKDGQIITTQSLDRENTTQRVVAIKVMAKDGGGRVAFCTVKIILTDENDNEPQFKASEYQVSIQSTVNKGTPVIQIVAYDADDGKNADVSYMVDKASEIIEDIIEINLSSGVVSVNKSLVGMENRILNFNVKARDGSLPFNNATVPVQLTVVPPEVPLPKFSEPLYTFSAAEDLPVGAEIGSVRANADTPVIYRLVNGNTVESNKDKVFSLDKESGTLLLQKNIDHESTRRYEIDVIAQGNHNGTEVTSLVSVRIQVRDVNDNQPVFDASPYRAFLAENLPAGTTVIQVTANDPDSDTNGLVTYSLESFPDMSDITEVFTIDGETGWITTARETDCETIRVFRLNVVATDHGGELKLSSTVMVEVMIMDENDNPPIFSEEVYRGSVHENSLPLEPIVTMTTTDRDVMLENRLVTCYITDGDALGQFAVVQLEDEWGLILKDSLDRERREKYELRVTATDGKFESSVRVNVQVLDVNDNSPQCEQLVNTEDVVENSPPNIFLLQVSASDPDTGTNGEISYTLHGPDRDKFRLDQRTGKLFTSAQLDREKDEEFRLVAKATDGGGRSCQADIVLRVQDENDNPPRFSSDSYHVTVFDNTTIRTPVAVLFAKDPDTGINSEVRYSLLEGEPGFFSLEQFTGVLRLERPLTTEVPPSFDLKVKASDRGLPHHLTSVATVTVEVISLEDYQPVFLREEVSVELSESSAPGSEVFHLREITNQRQEEEPVHYSILSGNEEQRFLLEPQTGLLTLSSLLDFELTQQYSLCVEGSHRKSSDIITLLINVTDVNDNKPTFEQNDYRAEVPEDSKPDSLVLKVTALDADSAANGLLRYSIVGGDPQQMFSIDPRSGDIRVRQELNREEVSWTDRHTHKHPHMHTHTHTECLSHPQVQHFALTVLAADEGHPSLSSAVYVTITVADVNDNPPTFFRVHHSLLLQEDEAVGSALLRLIVTDKDTPPNGPPFSFTIVSGNEDKRFHVDQGGLLSLSAPLRSNVRVLPPLKVQVTDSGRPPPLVPLCNQY